MSRQTRLDAPGTLHPVSIRGLERWTIVSDYTDREAFVARPREGAQTTGTAPYAWELLPSRAHLLLRSGMTGLPPFKGRLLTGYASTVNRWHARVGYRFPSRNS